MILVTQGQELKDAKEAAEGEDSLAAPGTSNAKDLGKDKNKKDANREIFVRIVQIVVILGLFVAWYRNVWPFNLENVTVNNFVDLAGLLLADPKVIGLTRIVVILLGLYAITSIISHIINGRYLIKVSKDGIEVGDIVNNQAILETTLAKSEEKRLKLEGEKAALQENLGDVKRRLKWTSTILERIMNEK